MSEYRDPIEFRDERGRSRFQPALSTGERLYGIFSDWAGDTYFWAHPADATADKRRTAPVLYSWRKAARIAAREARNRERRRLSTFREVTR